MAEPASSIAGVKLLGRRVLYFSSIDSTNSMALALASDPANEGLVIRAGMQTMGRGQHGRTWSAPAESGVLMSVLLFPPTSLRKPALLTAWAAVSVCRVVEYFSGRQPTIKWPNDVLVDGKKICGILIEQRATGSDQLATVAGIGLNVRQSAECFADAGLPEATSLMMLTNNDLACADVAGALIRCADDEYCRLLESGTAALESRWRERLELVGKKVAVECAGGPYHGILKSLTFSRVSWTNHNGNNVTRQPEQIRHLAEVAAFHVPS